MCGAPAANGSAGCHDNRARTARRAGRGIPSDRVLSELAETARMPQRHRSQLIAATTLPDTVDLLRAGSEIGSGELGRHQSRVARNRRRSVDGDGGWLDGSRLLQGHGLVRILVWGKPRQPPVRLLA